MSTLNKNISSTLERSLKQEICGELMWSLVLFKFKVGFPFDSPLNRFSLRTHSLSEIRTAHGKTTVLHVQCKQCKVYSLLFAFCSFTNCFDCCCCQFSLPVFPELITTRNEPFRQQSRLKDSPLTAYWLGYLHEEAVTIEHEEMTGLRCRIYAVIYGYLKTINNILNAYRAQMLSSVS